jgi:hypothetical protein
MQKVRKMTGIYDMVSGEWKWERSSSLEMVPKYNHPSTSAQSIAVQSESHTELVTENHFIPPDLADVCITHFLQRQVSPD